MAGSTAGNTRCTEGKGFGRSDPRVSSLRPNELCSQIRAPRRMFCGLPSLFAKGVGTEGWHGAFSLQNYILQHLMVLEKAGLPQCHTTSGGASGRVGGRIREQSRPNVGIATPELPRLNRAAIELGASAQGPASPSLARLDVRATRPFAIEPRNAQSIGRGARIWHHRCAGRVRCAKVAQLVAMAAQIDAVHAVGPRPESTRSPAITKRGRLITLPALELVA
jgi:hypothetical protein